MQLPVTLTLRPSRRLALLLLAVHGGALVLVAAIALPVWIKLALLPAIFWSAWRALKRIRGGQRIAFLMLRSDGRLDCTRCNDQVVEARIHPHTTVTPQLTVILLRIDKRIEPLVVLTDSLNAEEFRKLRLWLLWQAALD